MIVSIIVATGPKGEIGLNNKLLWHIKEDLVNFKKITSGKMVVMGRKTFESIGKPLPNRTNIVVTRDESYKADGVIVVNDPMMVFDLALEMENEIESNAEIEFELMICGGADIYKLYMPYAQRVYLSEVEYDGPCDTYFPKLNEMDWKVIHQQDFESFKFKIFERL